ncbi:MAG: hypothetical protein IKI65_05515, partial [Firmicutes bacterium]|nr:hypothetical protein [Bacillota bacterium]
NRLEATITEYEKYPVIKGKILLYGSSFFAKWGYERSQQMMSGYGGEEIATVNHGFGGSTGEEQLYYYGRMVRPYEPRMIVLRGGVNDLSKGYSPEEAAMFSIRVLEWARTDFPGIRLVPMAAFDYRSAPASRIFTLLHQYNRLMKQYAEENPNTWYLDISPFFYKKAEDVGTFAGFRDDVFGPDGLHLTDHGYEMFKDYFKAELAKIDADR